MRGFTPGSETTARLLLLSWEKSTEKLTGIICNSPKTDYDGKEETYDSKDCKISNVMFHHSFNCNKLQ